MTVQNTIYVPRKKFIKAFEVVKLFFETSCIKTGAGSSVVD
jgi:hypothetical protein